MDEVNLLDDHIVDLLLDVAAMGVNVVEREGISYSHPARFVLVGSMNPEEGDLRRSSWARFALAVDIQGIRDPQSRMQILERNLDIEADAGVGPIVQCRPKRSACPTRLPQRVTRLRPR